MSNRNHASVFFTIALQGVLVQKVREVVMGYKPISIISIPHINKECVEILLLLLAVILGELNMD